MPTYVYACKSCDDRYEVVQKMSDPPHTTCKECGGELRKVLFPPAVVYKGSGFYVTDYKNNGAKSESGASTSSNGTTATPASSESSASTSSESKPASTTTTSG